MRPAEIPFSKQLLKIQEPGPLFQMFSLQYSVKAPPIAFIAVPHSSSFHDRPFNFSSDVSLII